MLAEIQPLRRGDYQWTAAAGVLLAGGVLAAVINGAPRVSTAAASSTITINSAGPSRSARSTCTVSAVI